MSYELLGKLYYKDNKNYEDIYMSRKNSEFSTSFDWMILNSEAFYMNLPEAIIQSTRIYKKFADLNKLCAELPREAYTSYEKKCLIDEIMLTNDIEGISSTRKEIIDVLDDDNRSAKKKRFEGMVWKYVLLLDNTISPFEIELNTSQDIRDLYDEIVFDEISPANWPDGEIFRKDPAEVVSATQQVKHVGVHPEGKIIEYVDKVLATLKNENIPQLYKIAIIHYMIGYIHPFYDGNGRLGRFISSYLLKQEFNTLVALRLSYTIKNQKNEYYKAFDITNDPLNKGDLTHFIMYFSNVVEQSLDSLLEKLSIGKETLELYSSALEEKYLTADLKERRKTAYVLWYLIQNDLFSNEPFDKKQLAFHLQTGVETAHRYIESLIEAGAPITIEKEGRKYVYILDRVKLMDFLNS